MRVTWNMLTRNSGRPQTICTIATEHLYYRDSRFLTQRDAQGRKIFWGRGNGWVFAGLARILTELPADHPSRARYEALFEQMADKIVEPAGRERLLAGLVARATTDTGDQRHRLFCLWPGLGHSSRAVA